jgi:putative chitinase
MINREKFFKSCTDIMFNGFMKVTQADGIRAIIDEYERRQMTDIRHLAYILATVYHEVGKTMQPIEERGKGHGKPYGLKLKYSRKPYTSPDQIYYGRGLTQNTWYEVYESLTRAAKKQGLLDWDFLNHPELLLKMQSSIWATFHAMTTGLYTGMKLSYYFNDKKEDPLNARRIINVLDKAELIGSYYKGFMICLS